MYNALSVADYIVDYYISHGRGITIFKLEGYCILFKQSFL